VRTIRIFVICVGVLLCSGPVVAQDRANSTLASPSQPAPSAAFPIYCAGGDVKPPKVISTSDPKFSVEEKQ